MNLFNAIERLLGHCPTDDAEVSGAHKDLRKAVHDSRNAAAVSMGGARLSERIATSALRVAEDAIRVYEGGRDDTGNG